MVQGSFLALVENAVYRKLLAFQRKLWVGLQDADGAQWWQGQKISGPIFQALCNSVAAFGRRTKRKRERGEDSDF